MKNISFLLIVSFISISLFSCKKEEETSATASGLLEERLTAGNWKVTYFNSENTDQTAQFANYNFAFDKNRHLGFANTSLTVNGEWTVGEIQTVTDLNLGLTATEGNDQAGRVAGNWEVIVQSNDQLVLQRNVAGHPQESMNLEKLQ